MAISLVSTANGVAGTGPSMTPAISGDGRYVAFASAATNLSGMSAGSATSQIFVGDTWCGGSSPPSSACTPPLTLISVSQGGAGSNGSSSQPSISSDGSTVAFASLATDLVTPAVGNGQNPQVFVRGLTACILKCTLATIAVNATTSAWGSAPSLSADGRLVAYQETNVLGIPSNGDIKTASTCMGPLNLCVSQGGTWISNIASTPSPKTWVTGPIARPISSTPSLSGDGHVVTYSSPGSPIQIVFSLTGF